MVTDRSFQEAKDVIESALITAVPVEHLYYVYKITTEQTGPSILVIRPNKLVLRHV
jgi:hypothetical protein